MTTSTTSMIKDIGNILYNGILVATLTTGSRYATTKMLGMKDRDIKFDIKSLGMLALDLSVGMAGVQQLQSNNAIPKKIFQ